MSQKMIELAKVFQTPLKLNAQPGNKILIMTDTGMDPPDPPPDPTIIIDSSAVASSAPARRSV